MQQEWCSDGVSLPHEIEHALNSDSLVFFCGAGVSAASPSCLPGFRGLVEDIASDLGMSALLPADHNAPVQFDVIMGELNELQHDVHSRVSSRIRATVEPNSYHSDLLRLSNGAGRSTRIVTTNFDLLFERAAEQLEMRVTVHTAPALPLGDDFAGLVHLHGPVDPLPGQRLVVTDADFGRAYITEGWATQFLTRMFQTYVTVFVGYSADDTVMRYLARSLPSGGRPKFAFMAEEGPGEMSEKWARLGVTPITYPSPAGAPHASFRDFIEHWRQRVTATSAQRFDRIKQIVQAGPSSDVVSDDELAWLLRDPEHARHFRHEADATTWISRLNAQGILEEIFDPTPNDANEEESEWAQWASHNLQADGGDFVFAAITDHAGRLSPELWFQIWLQLRESVGAESKYRRWLLLLAADQPSRDAGRLSLLLRTVANVDIEAAEVLLYHLLIPRLKFRPNTGWTGREVSLDSDLMLDWAETPVRDAWPTILAGVTDPEHLLSVVLSLIRTAEATEALFSGTERRYALSIRRRTVDGVEQFRRDDPYVLVVDIARDLLREFVRNEGTNRPISYLDSPSEMVQRLAVDALAEARSSEGNALLRLVMARNLVFDFSMKSEVFRLLRAAYKNALPEVKVELLDHVIGTVDRQNGVEISDYERYNVLVWLADGQPEGDHVYGYLATAQAEHPDFGPRPYPDLDFWTSIDPADEIAKEPDGRFRGMSVSDVAGALSVDANLNDVYDSGPVITELKDFLNHAANQELPLMEQLIANEIWSTRAWATALTSAMEPGKSWTASEFLEKLAQIPSDLAVLSREIVFTVAYPNGGSSEALENAIERSRLLLGLWRVVLAEPSSAPPTDPSAASATARGSLAYYFVETTLRRTQDSGSLRIDPEGQDGLTEIMGAQLGDLADPSGIMLARYASHLLNYAPEWFELNMEPHLTAVNGSPVNLSIWAGTLSGNHISGALMRQTRGALRTGWPVVSQLLPGSAESFIEMHAAQFAYFTSAVEFNWADAFIAASPVTTRVRWIRSVARRLDGAQQPFDELLFAHWQHRVDGQPPLHGPEQRALLDWVMLPGMDVNRATDLFISGPPASVADSERGFDYYDFDDFPTANRAAFLRIGLHLLIGRTTLPSFTSTLIEAAENAVGDEIVLAQEVWKRLLSLGYGPARDRLVEVSTPVPAAGPAE